MGTNTEFDTDEVIVGSGPMGAATRRVFRRERSDVCKGDAHSRREMHITLFV